MFIILIAVLFAVLCFPCELIASAKPQLMLPSTTKLYALSQKPDAYIVSEKLDGIRAFWTGHKLLTKQGNPIHAPAWFLSAMPKQAIEGELWLGRGQFERLMSITAKSQPVDAQWQGVKFMAFDLPTSPLPFQQRLKRLESLVQHTQSNFIRLIPHYVYNSIKSIEDHLEQVVKAGGEGLILNLAAAEYKGGRQNTVLKVKPYYDDEAVVIDHIAGKGKLKGMMGALLVRDKRGNEFKIGTGFTVAQRRHPPKFGTTITYKYFGLTHAGKPKFASFLRSRPKPDQY